jgi:lipopolysaccharide/colanic/teichoic acid biosynthesis glycosyltransferase
MLYVTGATGFVGTQLLRRLGPRKDIVVVSRDALRARQLFPELQTVSYQDLSTRNLTDAVFIHLAVRNNDADATRDEYYAANVQALLDVAEVARQGGARLFINLSSTHALTAAPSDLYGQSKAEGSSKLAAAWPEGAINLYVPAIYGESFAGRLGALNRLPFWMREPALVVLRQVKPMISIDNLTRKLLALASAPVLRSEGESWATEYYAADPISERGLYVAGKRLFDMLGAISVLLLCGWMMVIIALYIRMDSKGPALFAQARVGRNGRVFTCYKFRTMSVGTAQVATHDVQSSAVTRAGHFLRRTKLDELPQVANVLLNQMSLVGPRPCLPVQEELIARRDLRGVLQIKPGVTGLAQINGIDMSDPGRLAAWDDRYRAFRTLSGDVKILLATVTGRGGGDRVRPNGKT